MVARVRHRVDDRHPRRMVGLVRVVSGSARGRRLVAPDGTTTRPTGDRVREALFNALHSLGLVVDATVVDLFAGSGALGIEALSRGASFCTFVESDRAAQRCIETNLRACGLEDRAALLRRDATRLDRSAFTGVDLVLADPPYSFDGWDRLLSVMSDLTLVAESDRSLAVPPGWDVLRERRYGDTVIHILTAPESESLLPLENSR